MCDKMQYRLSKNQKIDIAQNLIDILEKDSELTVETKSFIYNWIYSDASEKTKAFYDVWDIVLKNYLPKTKPILFRATYRLSKNGKIASFTGKLECARRFGNRKGYLIICDTNETLQFEDKIYQRGHYIHTFYPLVNVLIKAKESGGGGFSERLLEYINEDEYIMRIDMDNMYGLKWSKRI
ncbi:MAG TPA: hypothetical protein PKA78_05465 [Macellibacteroides fermentans]|uniref:hypothetical protein n=1 Tax=Macellibacteroides fermentans TaxID=879969 RepID=UPI002C30DCED|nr:hypothetical protein [Macellibacteroides fermentans]